LEVSSIAISSIAVAKGFSLNDDGHIGDERLLRVPKTTAGGYHGRAGIVIFVEMPSPRVSLSAVCVVEGRSCEWGCVSLNVNSNGSEVEYLEEQLAREARGYFMRVYMLVTQCLKWLRSGLQSVKQ
jgi:hypothetical protein